jgi:hypothetical protein
VISRPFRISPPTNLNQSDHPMRWPVSFDPRLRLRNSVWNQISLILCYFPLRFLIHLVRLPIKAHPQCLRAPFASSIDISCHETLFESSKALIQGERPGGEATARGSPQGPQQGSGGIHRSPCGILRSRHTSTPSCQPPRFCVSGTSVQSIIVRQRMWSIVSWSRESLGRRRHSESFENLRVQSADA